MSTDTKKSIEISGFLSVLGNEFMHHTGYGVYAFLNHQAIYDYYDQFATAKVPVQMFARKIVKDHLT